VFAGASEIGPLIPKIAIWNFSPAFTPVLITTRFGCYDLVSWQGLGSLTDPELSRLSTLPHNRRPSPSAL